MFTNESYAQSFERGIIKSITFEIEYPNGETKTVELPTNLMQNLGSLTIDESMVSPQDMSEWNMSSTDWMQNPAMILHYPSEGGNPPYSTPYCRWKWHVANPDR